ncbi:glucose-6-phosphate dehydrogenase [Candidatus Daviesbacteria bacterium]|nr:glucose-6-phosphate dehydrogenase [Candidatus Daviesbacteria bacterium]
MDSFTLIIFGITGNLAQIKLIPALYDIEEKNLLPKETSIIGIARSPQSKEEFREYIKKVLTSENRHHQHAIKDEVFEKLFTRMHYLNGNLIDRNLYKKLSQFLSQLDSENKKLGNRIFYLATYPDLYDQIFQNLQSEKLNEQKNGWVRLMIEKPIGNDLKSAKDLNKLLLSYFREDQIYRLDHYLGKETLQNILAFRFGNGIFEPLLNKDHVDHIQITATEDFGIGKRGGYYDSVGALKDVGQNHLLQMLAFATMDAPTDYSDAALTKERVKILENLEVDPKNLVLGQYDGYLKEESVNPNSSTDTFFAFKTMIKNARFKGVPIYVRGGKKLSQTVTEISIIFKTPHNRLFKHLRSGTEPNVLIFRIQPNEGIVLKILVKKPGHRWELDPTYMQFCYRLGSDSHYFPDPYERLIFDAIKGDQTFFNNVEEVESEWKFIDPLAKSKTKVHSYNPGSWGPKEADQFIQKNGRYWLEPSMDFCAI